MPKEQAFAPVLPHQPAPAHSAGGKDGSTAAAAPSAKHGGLPQQRVDQANSSARLHRKEEEGRLLEAVRFGADGTLPCAELRRRLVSGDVPQHLRETLQVALASAQSLSHDVVTIEDVQQALLLGTEESTSVLVQCLGGRSPAQGRWLERDRLVDYLVSRRKASDACATLPFVVVFCVVFIILVSEHFRVAASHSLVKALEQSLVWPDFAADYPNSFWTWLEGSPSGSAGILAPGVRAVGGPRVTLRPLDAEAGSLCGHSRADLISEAFSSSRADARPAVCRQLGPSDRRWIHWPLDGTATSQALASARAAWQQGQPPLNASLPSSGTGLAVQFVAQGVQSELYAYCEATLQLDASGLPLVRSSCSAFDARPVWLDFAKHVREGRMRAFVVILDMVFVVFGPLLLEMFRILSLCRRVNTGDGPCQRYATVWTAASWLSIACGIWMIVSYGYCESLTRGLRLLITDLPIFSEGSQYSTADFQTILAGTSLSETASYEAKLDHVAEQAMRLAAAWHQLRALAALMAACILLRLARAFSVNPRLRIIGRTLGRTFVDLSHVLVVFGAVLLVFALTGHMIYGGRLERFSTIASAIAHTLLMMGGYSYDDVHTEMRATGGTIGAVWVWLLGILLSILALRLVLATVISAYLQSRAREGAAPTLWRQALDVATERRRSEKAILTLAQSPEVSHPEWLSQGGAAPPRGPAARREIAKAVRKWTVRRVHEQLEGKGLLHSEKAVSSASLAAALGAETWAERARLDDVLRAATEAKGRGEAPGSLGDAARLAGRVEANVAVLAQELGGVRALLEGGSPLPASLAAALAEGGGDGSQAAESSSSALGVLAVPPSPLAGGAAEASGEQPPPPDLSPPWMPLALPGVPEGLEPGAGGIVRTLAADAQATAFDLRVALAQAQGVPHEDHELLMSGRLVLGDARLHDLLEGQDPDDVEVALVPALVHAETPKKPLAAPPKPQPSEAKPQLGGVALPTAESLAEERAAREERLDALDRGDALRCAQLEEWVARLMQGVEHLEQRRAQVAEERLQRLQSLEQSLDDLFDSIRPALGGPVEPA